MNVQSFSGLLFDLLTDEESVWRGSAVCKGANPDIFFPERGMTTTRAKAICAACPVREPCLDYALIAEPIGVWGGKSADERQEMCSKMGGRIAMRSRILAERRNELAGKAQQLDQEVDLSNMVTFANLEDFLEDFNSDDAA